MEAEMMKHLKTNRASTLGVYMYTRVRVIYVYITTKLLWAKGHCNRRKGY